MFGHACPTRENIGEPGGTVPNAQVDETQLRASEPTNPPQPAPRRHVGFGAVDDVTGRRAVLLRVERPMRGVDRDLGPFLVVTKAVVEFVKVVDAFLVSSSLNTARDNGREGVGVFLGEDPRCDRSTST